MAWYGGPCGGGGGGGDFGGSGGFGQGRWLGIQNEEEWQKTFQEVKKNVRSLLISTKTGLSTVEILRDYTNFINKPLPYR